jgi:hypothetical protein
LLTFSPDSLPEFICKLGFHFITLKEVDVDVKAAANPIRYG